MSDVPTPDLVEPTPEPAEEPDEDWAEGPEGEPPDDEY
jgi:hypothetical protein